MTTEKMISRRHSIMNQALIDATWEAIGNETDGLNGFDSALNMTLIHRAEHDGDVTVYRSSDFLTHALVADANGPIYVLVKSQ